MNKPENIIPIPVIDNFDLYERNKERADSQNLDSCPCCGKAIKNPTNMINSIYGGDMYPSQDKNVYNDAWVMGVGSECAKRFPKGYVYKIKPTDAK